MFQTLTKYIFKQNKTVEPLQEIVIHPFYLEQIVIYNPLYGMKYDNN